MSFSIKPELSALIADIDAIASASLPPDQAARLAPVFPAYFEEAEVADLKRFTAADVFGAALSHLEFAQQRQFGHTKVRVYNPDIERHGWQSTHTVIEIVNEDMPFLIDTLAMLLARRNVTLHLLIHPVLEVERDAAGEAVAIRRAEQHSSPLESFIHAQIDRITDPEQLAELAAELEQVLTDVEIVVHDGDAMRQQVLALADQLQTMEHEEAPESAEYLRWVADNHFLLMGFCDYDLVCDANGCDALRIVAGSGLGILRNQGDKEYSESFAQLPQTLREYAHVPRLLVLNKSQTLSTIHRAAHLDYIGIKRFDAQGKVIGERRVLGLYTASAYHASPRDIPVLRQKIRQVCAALDYVDNSYKAKTLNFVLETYPRDELFEVPADVLTPIAEGLVNLQERPRTRLFARKDHYHRYVSCLVFIPRDSFNTEVRLKIEALLLEAFNGTHAEFSVAIADLRLARVHYIVHTPAADVLDYDEALLETAIARVVRGWSEELHQHLIETRGEEDGNHLFYRYRDAFPVAYREEFDARNAVLDVQQLEALSAAQPLSVKLYRPFQRNAGRHHLKVFRFGEPVSLSESLPVLESLGVRVRDERPYRVTRADGAELWINDFGLVAPDEQRLDDEAVRIRFQELLLKVTAGQAESDGFNRLALAAGLDWREVTLIRALAKYLRQGGLTFSQQYIEHCVANYAAISSRLVALFHARLHPTQRDEAQAALLLQEIGEALTQVANIDEDKILNAFLTVILAIRRTNFYQRKEQQPKAYLSFKLESGKVDFLPLPRPLYEIWVYSPRVEGVHLRGSKVARGGLRWSDRMEDFRTEVLGLVKAQMVKNSVIVPMGSKGGFVVKQASPADRETWLAEGVACYKMFISGLLDLTDNICNGQIVPPVDTVRLDEDDPYLVVAADKGTASFSDIANGVSEQYGFWLADAFASGGSVGYDHKKMGITARGAWESVKRNFRHLGINTQEQDFTVIGVGDMSGDVFGNGMLLSQHIRLLAAFDHRHIFIDPQPNASVSFAERARLFELPRSSWADYDATLISEGGGVFDRKLKSITLSPQIKAWLGTERDSMAPNELIHEILKAPADLLYNGGIGTYVKASHQPHSAANDRTNDAVRVDGCQLRVKVVGEGGNLGFTQAGRVEFAMKGGLIFTDAIDNSAGVDCSDHEVNIKILLGSVVAAGDMTLKQRNVLLAEMTEEVGSLVLRNNYLQTQILAINRYSSAQMLNAQSRLITAMEKSGELKRALEGLPSDEQIAERRANRQGLTAPEVAVLLAYSKIALDRALLASDVPDEADFLPILTAYFPQPLQQRFAEAMQNHHLKREIIANQLANRIVNRMGITFAFRLREEMGVSDADIARAFWAADGIFAAEALWQRIEALDNAISADIQVELMIRVRTLVERAARWILHNRRHQEPISALLARYHASVQTLMNSLPSLVASADDENVAQMERHCLEQGVPAELAALISRLDFAAAFFDIAELAEEGQLDREVVAANYFQLGKALELDWLRDAITRLPRDNRWQSLARSALRDDLYRMHRGLTEKALACEACQDGRFASHWLANRQEELELCHQMLIELRAYPALDLAMLSAGMRELSNRMMV